MVAKYTHFHTVRGQLSDGNERAYVISKFLSKSPTDPVLETIGVQIFVSQFSTLLPERGSGLSQTRVL